MALLFNGLAVGAVTMATLLPVAALGYWLLIGDGDIRQMVGLSAEALPVIAVGQRLGAALVALLTILPLAWALVRLRVCLVCFSRGKPFASEGIRALRDFALGSMLASIAQFFSHAAMSLVLTATAIAGHKQISLGISSQMLLMIMFAGVIAALAWAMEKAAAIAEENSQFI
ncbi:DUF2975 domain-containing protein [Devosia lucknowensis]|nr:DUF2975 domain-containing protein [Devosia lucknowensis]